MNAERLERMPLKQYIILRKDATTVTGAPVSPQKLAVMTAHASMCFLSHMVLEHCNANGHVVMDLDAEAFDGCVVRSQKFWFNHKTCGIE